MNNKKLFLILLLVFMLLITACKKEEENEDIGTLPEFSYEGELKFTGAEKEFAIPYDDIYSIGAMTLNIESASAAYDTVGCVRLETILRDKDIDLLGYDAVRFISLDGSYVDVSNEMLLENDIILTYKIDGEYLSEENRPLIVMKDDGSADYCITQLAEIQFVTVNSEN